MDYPTITPTPNHPPVSMKTPEMEQGLKIYLFVQMYKNSPGCTLLSPWKWKLDALWQGPTSSFCFFSSSDILSRPVDEGDDGN